MTEEIRTRGLNHLALVCSDMKETIDFYEGLLGFRLIKTIDLPGGRGQHFFFDIGNGASLAFFWFPEAPPAAPGISSQAPDSVLSGIGSMNHVAFDVALEDIERYREVLVAKGIDVTEVVNHDDSPSGRSPEMHEGVFVRSIYFWGPDGIKLELAAWSKEFGPEDVRHEPARKMASVSN